MGRKKKKPIESRAICCDDRKLTYTHIYTRTRTHACKYDLNHIKISYMYRGSNSYSTKKYGETLANSFIECQQQAIKDRPNKMNIETFIHTHTHRDTRCECSNKLDASTDIRCVCAHLFKCRLKITI